MSVGPVHRRESGLAYRGEDLELDSGSSTVNGGRLPANRPAAVPTGIRMAAPTPHQTGSVRHHIRSTSRAVSLAKQLPNKMRRQEASADAEQNQMATQARLAELWSVLKRARLMRAHGFGDPVDTQGP